MCALPQRYGKATAKLWEHDRYHYRNATAEFDLKNKKKL